MTPPLFSVLANQLIGPITKKGFFAGEYVHFGQFLMACQYLFETGVTAAEVFSDRLLVFVKLFSDAGAEEQCLQYLRECATKRMADRWGRAPEFPTDFSVHRVARGRAA
jgi:hypothetical protein